MKHLLALLGLAVLLVAPSQVNADQWSLQSWLNLPGTRLVAVEFYSTNCPPCIKAVPKWQALRDKYANDGLRLADS